jgi:hypothetical protein
MAREESNLRTRIRRPRAKPVRLSPSRREHASFGWAPSRGNNGNARRSLAFGRAFARSRGSAQRCGLSEHQRTGANAAPTRQAGVTGSSPVPPTSYESRKSCTLCVFGSFSLPVVIRPRPPKLARFGAGLPHRLPHSGELPVAHAQRRAYVCDRRAAAGHYSGDGGKDLGRAPAFHVPRGRGRRSALRGDYSEALRIGRRLRTPAGAGQGTRRDRRGEKSVA